MNEELVGDGQCVPLFDIKMIHRYFGWFFSVGIGIFVLLTPLHPFQYMIWFISIWSAMRKKQITWDLSQRQWVIRTRNYWVWRERRFDMTNQDLLKLTWSSARDRVSSSDGAEFEGFTLKFEPKDPNYKGPKLSFGSITLAAFNRHVSLPFVAEQTNQILRSYQSIGMRIGLKHDYRKLSSNRYKELQGYFGLDYQKRED